MGGAGTYCTCAVGMGTQNEKQYGVHYLERTFLEMAATTFNDVRQILKKWDKV
jgi:hypothetical protein